MSFHLMQSCPFFRHLTQGCPFKTIWCKGVCLFKSFVYGFSTGHCISNYVSLILKSSPAPHYALHRQPPPPLPTGTDTKIIHI